MLPVNMIVKIEELIKQPNKSILIMCPSIGLRQRIRGEDMARIAFPCNKKTNNREKIVLENDSCIKFTGATDNAGRGSSYDLIVMVNVSEQTRERLNPALLPCLVYTKGEIVTIDIT